MVRISQGFGMSHVTCHMVGGLCPRSIEKSTYYHGTIQPSVRARQCLEEKIPKPTIVATLNVKIGDSDELEHHPSSVRSF